jgi:hypothetical protein
MAAIVTTSITNTWNLYNNSFEGVVRLLLISDLVYCSQLWLSDVVYVRNSAKNNPLIPASILITSFKAYTFAIIYLWN